MKINHISGQIVANLLDALHDSLEKGEELAQQNKQLAAALAEKTKPQEPNITEEEKQRSREGLA